MKTESKPTRASDPNRIADPAFRASIGNIICWIPIAVPNILDSPWSIPFLVAILLSAVIALGAGMWGMLKVQPSEKAVGRSLFGVIIGGINMILIILSIIAIYGLANSGIW